MSNVIKNCNFKEFFVSDFIALFNAIFLNIVVFLLYFMDSLENVVILWRFNQPYMKYRIKKETKPTLPTFGKYKAVAVHHQTIESRQLFEEAARQSSISAGVLEALMISVSEAVTRHLRNGDKVRLKDIGLLKLEIESEKVDNLKDFRAKKHIRGVRLHLIPESSKGSPDLYKDITFEKDKNYVEE